MSRTVIWDCETDGLLPEVSMIWCICLSIIEDGVMSPIYSYVNNPATGEDDLDDAVAIIEEADMVVGHNLMGYDLRVLEKLYPDFSPKEGQIVRDTQVLSQMLFANEKDKDFDRFRRGTLEGKLIGRFGLEAWGQRLGHFKGDYAKEMKAMGKDPWKEFDHVRGVPYCEDDVEVTRRLWLKCENMNWSPEAVVLEHTISELMLMQEEDGIWFNVAEAKKLAEELQAEYDRLNAKAVEHFGSWWVPEKKYAGEPRADFGEDDSRPVWAEVTIEKRETRVVKEKEGELAGVTRRFSSDAPYCKVKKVEFNPNSRPQIIDRLKFVYDWQPVDFTEKGNPEVNDEVLRGLAPHWPICEELAELFFYNKLLGQLANGANAWLTHVDENGFLHGRCNPGGTRSGRASHSSPNLAQVPKVVVVDVIDKATGEFNPKVLGKDGKPFADCFKEDGTPKKSVILKGRAGDYGWECRNLFGAPKLNGQQWWMMGCDLKGVELRCFGHHLAEYDGGEYADIVINGDVHTVNQNAAGLNSRDNAKTFIYACLGLDVFVVAADGSLHSSSTIKVGDIVKTYNLAEQKEELAPVLEIVKYEDAKCVSVPINEDGDRITVSINHRFPVYRYVLLNGHASIIREFCAVEDFDEVTYLLSADTGESFPVFKDDILPVDNQPVWCIRTKNQSLVASDGQSAIYSGNTLYGAGDEKIGSIVCMPNTAVSIMKARGRELKQKFQEGLPAYKQLVKRIAKECRQGYLTGLDGRKLWVKSPHSALNLQLQSDGAILAKKWVILFNQYMEEAGYIPGWHGDFVQCLWIHDEIQVACRTKEIAEIASQLALKAAVDAGKSFNYRVPIEADSKIGLTWSQTH